MDNEHCWHWLLYISESLFSCLYCGLCCEVKGIVPTQLSLFGLLDLCCRGNIFTLVVMRFAKKQKNNINNPCILYHTFIILFACLLLLIYICVFRLSPHCYRCFCVILTYLFKPHIVVFCSFPLCAAAPSVTCRPRALTAPSASGSGTHARLNLGEHTQYMVSPKQVQDKSWMFAMCSYLFSNFCIFILLSAILSKGDYFSFSNCC